MLNDDGTWGRRRTSASSHSSETQYGGAGYDGYDGNRVNVGGGGRGGHEDGDVGHNTTGGVGAYYSFHWRKTRLWEQFRQDLGDNWRI